MEVTVMTWVVAFVGLVLIVIRQERPAHKGVDTWNRWESLQPLTSFPVFILT